MLAADADLEIGLGLAALRDAQLDQATDATDIQRLERIRRQELLREVVAQERADVIAREAKGHLRQVVGAEAEEVRGLGDLVGRHGGAGHLDHRADLDVQARLVILGLLDLRDHGLALRPQRHELLLRANQRDHDLREDLDVAAEAVDRGLDDRADLHVQDLGIRHAQAAATVAQHRVGLVQLLHARTHLRDRHPHDLRKLGLLLLLVRHELVQRRIDQADRDRLALHRLEDADEVLALVREQLVKGLDAGLLRLREDHLAHRADAVSLEEHVLGAAEANAFGPEVAGPQRVRRRVRVGADTDGAILVRPLHHLAKVAGHLGLDRPDRAGHHLAGAAVD